MIGSIVHGDVVEAIHKSRAPPFVARLMFEARLAMYTYHENHKTRS